VPEDDDVEGDVGSHELAHEGSAAGRKPLQDENNKKKHKHKRRASQEKEKESSEESDELSPAEVVPAQRSVVGPKKKVRLIAYCQDVLV
jgi:hypothetical protein